jgi:hypothetical protein
MLFAVLGLTWLEVYQSVQDPSRLNMTLDKLQPYLKWPPNCEERSEPLSRITGSMLGLAVGDALGASTEFRPYEYMCAHPVKDMIGGGTWGLKKGQVWIAGRVILMRHCVLVSACTHCHMYDSFCVRRRLRE